MTGCYRATIIMAQHGPIMKPTPGPRGTVPLTGLAKNLDSVIFLEVASIVRRSLALTASTDVARSTIPRCQFMF
jgi:hypothetical protein